MHARIAIPTFSALLFLSSSLGCALTQRTDRYFIGSTGGPPVYENRTVTGLCLIPLAVVGDVVTFPIQVFVLVVAGDGDLYSHAQSKNGTALGPAVDRKALAQLQGIQRTMTATAAPPAIYGIDASGEVKPIDVSRQEVNRIVATMAR